MSSSPVTVNGNGNGNGNGNSNDNETEKACRFVSSRGLMKSCTVYSKNPKSSSPDDLYHVSDFIESAQNRPNSVAVAGAGPSPGPVSIYVCCDAFQHFIQKDASQIRVPYVVVCGDGDMTMFRETVPKEKHNTFVMFMLNPDFRGLFSQNMDIHECRQFLSDKITKLWAANAAIFKHHNAPKTLEDAINTVHKKLRQIPIGMDYHTIYANTTHPWVNPLSSAETTMTTPVAQERILIEQIRATMNPFYKRKIRIYSNVMLCLDRFNDRVSAIREIPADLVFQQACFLPRTMIWKSMKEYAFVLSPFGNGMDCHRTWEALLCGCIPIVRSCVFDELFAGLPVLIVKNWSDISLDLLVATMSKFKDKLDKNQLRYEKLELAYYTKMISGVEEGDESEQ